MRFLFAAFIISMCALLWAAVAVARHIRRHGANERRRPENDSAVQFSTENTPGEGPAGKDSGIHGASALNTPRL
jgi:hypothetical protein